MRQAELCGALTRLTRLAQRQPETTVWIVDVILDNLPDIVWPAIEVALETGPPMPEALEMALKTADSLEAAEVVARRVPLGAESLQELAISAIQMLLHDPGWPADYSGEERRVRRHALEVVLGRRLALAGRPSEGLAVIERALGGLRRLDGIAGATSWLIRGHDFLTHVLLGQDDTGRAGGGAHRGAAGAAYGAGAL